MKESLSEKRWAEAKRRTSESIFFNSAVQAYSRARSTTPVGEKRSFIFDNKGKDVKFRPDVFRNPVDAINDCMKNFDEQARKNINIIKAAREANGCTITCPNDLNDVKAQFKEHSSTTSGGFYKYSRHAYVREWLGTICIFEVFEEKTGKIGNRFNGFIVDKVLVVYYNKEHKFSKEVVLKCDFWMIKKLHEDSQQVL